ncbi:MAG TPA: YceI family protein [Gaiellales bacterium]
MAIKTGTYRLGPDDGTLSVRTGRTGAAAKAGHNLLLHVGTWSVLLVAGDDAAGTSVQLDADAASLRVREGHGGMQALGDDDRASIEQTIDEDVLKKQSISFRSTRLEPTADGAGFRVEGELSIVGTTRPVTFEIAVDEGGTLRGGMVLKQSDWGIKPYSTLFGALKVVDEVEVALEASLPAS